MVSAESDPRAVRTRSVAPGTLLLFTVAYAVAIVLGRLSVQPETGLAFFWPASGIAVVWALTSRTPAALAWCSGVVLLLAWTGNAATGFSVVPGAVLGVANVVMCLVPRLVLHRLGRTAGWAAWPGLRGVSGVGAFLLAVGLGAVTSSVVGMVGIALAGREPSLLAMVGWSTRNGAAAVVIGLPLLVRPGGGGGSRWSRWGPEAVALRARPVEVALMVAATVLVLWIVFGPERQLPLAFLPFALVVWVGLRLTPTLAAAYGSLLAMAVLALVQGAQGGPFGAIPDPGQQAFTLQAFMVLPAVLGLSMAMVIDERDRLAERLASSERAARETASQLAVIADTMPVGLFVLDATGRTLLTNPTAHQLLGTSAEGYFAEPRAVRLARLDGTPVPAAERPSSVALAGHSVHDLPLATYDLATGNRRVWLFDAAPLPVAEDGTARALVAFRDITEHQERMTQLESFAGVVAHDLQSPVSAVHAWSELMVDQLADIDPDDAQLLRRSLSHVQAATRRGSQLIADLLDYSVVGTSQVHHQDIDLDALVAQLAAGLSVGRDGPRAQVRHHDLGWMVGDPVLVRQLFANLLGNAVKYTPPERAPLVEVAAVRSETGLEVTVSDNGVGIPAEERTRVFEPFRRAHASDVRFTGTGLGLAICAQAVHRHGGTIAVEPNPTGTGSRFVLSLPASVLPEAVQRPRGVSRSA